MTRQTPRVSVPDFLATPDLAERAFTTKTFGDAKARRNRIISMLWRPEIGC